MNICISREELSPSTDCRELTDLEEITIDITSPCLNYFQQCPPLFLTISVTTSRSRCSGTYIFIDYL
ncbi:hypothetical protein C0J52_01818 [Blattella germanica]|nr:hypothetical protein C0J52_01818 [Blattella germanica]